MRFSEKLTFLRKKHGMTQMELAEKLDISRQAVSRWEQGVSEPSTENLVIIGKLFGVPVDDLVNDAIQLQTEMTVQMVEPSETDLEIEQNRAQETKNKEIAKRKIRTWCISVAAICLVVIMIFGVILSHRYAKPEVEPEIDVSLND